MLAVAIVAIGVLGPAPARPSPSTGPSDPQLALGPSPTPANSLYPEIASLTGVPRFFPAPTDIRTSWLAENVTLSLAADGTRLFFVTGGTTLQSTVIGSGSPPTVIATVPECQTIAQVAAAGNVLGFVETAPVGARSAAGCVQSSSVAWSIWLSDINGAHKRRVASGVRQVNSDVTRAHPVRLGLTSRAFAYDRPNSPGLVPTGETIVVNDVATGKRLWAVQTEAAVIDLMFGGSTIGVLDREPALRLSIATEGSPGLTPFAFPLSSAALSDDGRYVSWDTVADSASGVASGLATTDLTSGVTSLLAVPSEADRPAPLRPTVATTGSGAAVAWFQTVKDGIVYPAVDISGAATGGLYSTVQAPLWISLNGNIMTMVATDSDGRYTVAYAVDLSGSGFADS